jgi:hypothetical protein
MPTSEALPFMRYRTLQKLLNQYIGAETSDLKVLHILANCSVCHWLCTHTVTVLPPMLKISWIHSMFRSTVICIRVHSVLTGLFFVLSIVINNTACYMRICSYVIEISLKSLFFSLNCWSTMEFTFKQVLVSQSRLLWISSLIRLPSLFVWHNVALPM